MVRAETKGSRGIGVLIRQARRSMGLRQGDLASLTGLPTSHLSEIERGTILPTIPTLERIGAALHRPLEYFLQEDSPGPRSLGMVIQEGSNGARAAAKFAGLVEAKTNGEIRLHLYQYSALGTAREQVEALPRGAVHFYLDEMLCFEPYVMLCGVVFQPFFFRDRQHYQRFLDSPLFERNISEVLLADGIRLLNPSSNWLCGSFEVLFSNAPIFTPADLVGRKLRSYPSDVSIDIRRCLGSEPVVVEWGKVGEAFEAGEIDTFLAPASYTLSTGVHKMAHYATVLDTGYTLNLTIAIAEREYRKLSPDVQQVLDESAVEAGEYCTQLSDEQSLVDLQLLQDEYGIPLIHPDMKAWREAFEVTLRETCLGKRISSELYTDIQGL
jgi:TRAP-type transport system periplasmic protein